MLSLRPRDGEGFQSKGKLQEKAMLAPRALARKTLPSLRALEIQGNGYHRPIAESCFAPAKRNMAVARREWLEGTGTVH